MTPRKALLLSGLLVLAIIAYLIGRPQPEPSKQEAAEPSAESNSQATSTTTPLSRAETLRARTPSPKANLEKRINHYTDGSVDLVDALKISSELHSSSDPRQDLELVTQLLQQYRFLFETNPVGTENFEFTAALTGDNPKKVNLIDPDSPALNSSDELVDRWGSPFVFHPLSGTEMELRSLGPDQTLWTKDDLTFK